eukprot:TRINITY_DN43389_c0_g1_i1.p1 TRINITY_DN43389_c0_g1~~TRINITY_DN43389_c0_g1_i1.p1  ORF type:complete len:521 (+),score=123.23 TRINITY_DN43389_c0_g1_i1:64-1626(+)
MNGFDDVWSRGTSEPALDSDVASDEEAASVASEHEARARTDVPEDKAFRAHRGYLYDTLLQRTIDRPAAVARWLPDVRLRDNGMLEARLLVATGEDGGSLESAGRQHYMTVLKIVLPSREETPVGLRVSADTGELGGLGHGPTIRSTVDHQLYHDGPVTALEVWECNPTVVLTCSSSRADVHVYCTSRIEWAKTQPPSPDRRALQIPEDAPQAHKRAQRQAALQAQRRVEEWRDHSGTATPALVLTGLDAPATALAVSHCAQAWVAATAPGRSVPVWRLPESLTKDREQAPCSRLKPPASTTLLKFSYFHPSRLVGGCADGSLWVVDVLELDSGAEPSRIVCGSQGAALTCADFSYCAPDLLVVGDAEGTCRVVDLRVEQPLWELKAHCGPTNSVCWCPQQPSVFVSAGEDGYSCLWDLDAPEDEECDLPSELTFKHAGHRHPVTRVAMHRHMLLRGLVATVGRGSEGNLSVWRPRNEFWVDHDSDDEGDDEDSDRPAAEERPALRSPTAAAAPPPPLMP